MKHMYTRRTARKSPLRMLVESVARGMTNEGAPETNPGEKWFIDQCWGRMVEDDYKNGESTTPVEEFNQADVPHQFMRTGFDSPLDMVKAVCEKYFGVDYDEEAWSAWTDEHGDVRLTGDYQVDRNGMAPTESDVGKWTLGKEKLYTLTINIIPLLRTTRKPSLAEVEKLTHFGPKGRPDVIDDKTYREAWRP